MCRLRFGTGTYEFRATFNYPQLDQLSSSEVLNNASQGLVKESPDLTTSLSFLSYSNKLLAGSWRFLTYFGRDSMLSALLMQDILSQGEGSALEAVIGAVIERINKTDGTVCHEENLGDYASFLARQKGIDSSAPSCDYKMVDTDFLFPILMKDYFVNTDTGKSRAALFLNRKATFLEENAGIAYSDLAQRTAEKIMSIAAPFVSSQTASNLIHLKDGQSVGQWRDSNTGLGGGRIPYDVNTALVPAGLRAIAALSKAGFFPDHPDWTDIAAKYAQVWEDETLHFFKVSVSRSEAQQLVEQYVSDAALAGPSNTDQITDNITFYGLALGGADNKPVRVMNTDDCFRHFLLNTTNQDQLSAFLDQTADHILQSFPVGLSTDIGLFVANPAFTGDKRLSDEFKNSDYHGTVVWSWQLAMMAAGLGRQLARCCETCDSPSKRILAVLLPPSTSLMQPQISAARIFARKLRMPTTRFGIRSIRTARS
jgi:glycogen debranching enzyme